MNFSVSRAGSSELQKPAGAAHAGESRLPERSGSQKSVLEREREREREREMCQEIRSIVAQTL